MPVFVLLDPTYHATDCVLLGTPNLACAWAAFGCAGAKMQVARSLNPPAVAIPSVPFDAVPAAGIRGDIVVLSARPREFRSKNWRLVKAMGIVPSTVLCGDASSLESLRKVLLSSYSDLRALLWHTYYLAVVCVRATFCIAVSRTGKTQMCIGKAKAFGCLSRLYPEYRFALLGDSGQADAMCAAAVTRGSHARDHRRFRVSSV